MQALDHHPIEAQNTFLRILGLPERRFDAFSPGDRCSVRREHRVTRHGEGQFEGTAAVLAVGVVQPDPVEFSVLRVQYGQPAG